MNTIHDNIKNNKHKSLRQMTQTPRHLDELRARISP